MEARKDRVYFEINENTCKVDGNKLILTVPSEQQSMDGIDFYFNKDFVKDKEFLVSSVKISPAPLMCYWNWLLHKNGCPEYQCSVDTPIDITIYQISGVPGGFGFSGYAPDESDIIITFELCEAKDNTDECDVIADE